MSPFNAHLIFFLSFQGLHCQSEIGKNQQNQQQNSWDQPSPHWPHSPNPSQPIPPHGPITTELLEALEELRGAVHRAFEVLCTLRAHGRRCSYSAHMVQLCAHRWLLAYHCSTHTHTPGVGSSSKGMMVDLAAGVIRKFPSKDEPKCTHVLQIDC